MKTLIRRCKTYGITIDQFNAMWLQQGGKCKICHTPVLQEGTLQSCIDHCHTSLKVRGILCHSCNVTLARVEKVGLDSIKNYLDTAAMIGQCKVKKPRKPQIKIELVDIAAREKGRPPYKTDLGRAMTGVERSRACRARQALAGVNIPLAES